MSERVLPKQQLLRNAVGMLDGPYCEVITPTREERQLFLAHVAIGGSMLHAAKQVGIPYLSFGKLMVVDERFSLELQAALELRKMALEELLVEQSTVGVDKIVLVRGVPIVGPDDKPITYKELITSNPSLLALLKANHPEKFRERSEVVHRDGPGAEVPVNITSEADRQKVIEYLDSIAAARYAEEMEKLSDEDLL